MHAVNMYIFGLIAWPPHSPDLTPFDCFLWHHMNIWIYETLVETEDDLLLQVLVASQKIEDMPGLKERVYQDIIHRYNVCNNVVCCYVKLEL